MMDVTRMVVSWANSWAKRPWAWGVCDCTTLTLSWLDVLTIGDNLALAAGLYSDETTARAHAEGCGHTLESLIRYSGGCDVPAGHQQPGDFIIGRLPGDPWQRGHVCLGTHALSAIPDVGVVSIPLRLIPYPHLILRVPCLPRS